ncbi:hypothetical protein [Salinivibrio kushneri]|uniref:Uncharacterized protein n=1 Tax=Salinivibrio kushneri TaxID=1908198 RepID=A0AB36K1H5_9GAMM|nr:hypothetical protein [Salinivibrio kushneri]OOE41381.1 hypothetical protein BZG09_15675 [Salinivibrio kushneri]
MKDHAIIAELLGQGANLSISRIVVRMCEGNYTVAAVLSQLIFWSNRASQKGGWFYKSQVELAEELELSRDQVKRAISKAKSLHSDVIETRVRRANGAPTTHFKINFESLIEAAKTVMAESPNRNGETAQSIGRNRPNHGADAPNPQGGTAQSITDPNTDPITDPNNNNTRKSALDFSTWPSEPSRDVFKDWKTLRDKKRAPITQTVINRLGKKITDANQRLGLTVDDVLGVCVERGWQGFEVAWLENYATQPGGKQAQLEQRNRSAVDEWLGENHSGNVYDHK